MKVKLINPDSRDIKEIDAGFCYLFYPCFLTSFLVLPLALFAIFRKQVFTTFTQFVIFFFMLPGLLYMLRFIGPIGSSTALIITPIFLFYIFYIVPKFMNRWRINGLLERGYEIDKTQSAVKVEYFNKVMENDSYAANLFK